MSQMPIVIFDDGRGRFGPLTDRRPAFALRSGAWTTRQRIEHSLHQHAQALLVPRHLADVCAAREPSVLINDLSSWGDRPVLLINGRWPADAVDWSKLPTGVAWVQGDDLLAVRITADLVLQWWQGGSQGVPAGCVCESPDLKCSAALYTRPWHLLDQLDRVLLHDLYAIDLPHQTNNGAPGIPGIPGITIVGNEPLKIHPTARVFPHTVFNTEQGPIVIDAHAILQPFTLVEGPAYLGVQSELAVHTVLRSTTVVGPMCKVGGEVKASILTGYTNKAHLGYLGNAILGAWCNLGADTNVSNLKNTYGPVRMQLDAQHEAEDTGRTFQGPILGDFVRTAIGTRLVTGSCIGTGCSIVMSSMAPKFAEPMGFYTDKGRQPYDLDAFFATADAMMKRRQKQLNQADRALIRSLLQ